MLNLYPDIFYKAFGQTMDANATGEKNDEEDFVDKEETVTHPAQPAQRKTSRSKK